MQLHDTHFHLDLFGSADAVLNEIERSGIYTIAVTNLPVLFQHTYDLVANCKYVRAALGFHPELVASRSSQITHFNSLLARTRYIGEVGLDNFYKSSVEYAGQKKVFEQIIRSCDDIGGKILTVHSRRAEKDLISIIGPSFNGKIVLHWYSGNIKDLERAVECGFYFSVNYAMTQSLNGRKIISCIPQNRILLETDGPYIKHEGVPCSPLMIENTAKKVIELMGASITSSPAQGFLSRNFSELISTPLSGTK